MKFLWRYQIFFHGSQDCNTFLEHPMKKKAIPKKKEKILLFKTERILFTWAKSSPELSKLIFTYLWKVLRKKIWKIAQGFKFLRILSWKNRIFSRTISFRVVTTATCASREIIREKMIFLSKKIFGYHLWSFSNLSVVLQKSLFRCVKTPSYV